MSSITTKTLSIAETVGHMILYSAVDAVVTPPENCRVCIDAWNNGSRGGNSTGTVKVNGETVFNVRLDNYQVIGGGFKAAKNQSVSVSFPANVMIRFERVSL